MTTTTDPVGVAEIAERLDLPYGTISGWRTRGVLPDPDWVRGQTPLWAWETLREHEAVKPVLDGFDDAVAELVPADRLLRTGVFDGKREWEVAQRRWDRQGCGYISVPIRDGGRWVLTDGEAPFLEDTDYVPAMRALKVCLKAGGRLRVSRDWRGVIASTDPWT